MTPEDAIEHVRDAESFLRFVEALEADRREELEKEKVSPSLPYSQGTTAGRMERSKRFSKRHVPGRQTQKCSANPRRRPRKCGASLRSSCSPAKPTSNPAWNLAPVARAAQLAVAAGTDRVVLVGATLLRAGRAAETAWPLGGQKLNTAGGNAHVCWHRNASTYRFRSVAWSSWRSRAHRHRVGQHARSTHLHPVRSDRGNECAVPSIREGAAICDAIWARARSIHGRNLAALFVYWLFPRKNSLCHSAPRARMAARLDASHGQRVERGSRSTNGDEPIAVRGRCRPTHRCT